ncbi:MAG: energy-coupling factor transport system permease protein [Solirubrobacteraceae bacterium]|nr:energy-coupling factor transport system permease protein [Solirubrobacteraceae bacterium]
MIYRHRASPLHAARASASCAYCAALATVALVLDHPLALAAVLCGVVGAALLAGVGAQMRRAFTLALPLALAMALINPLVTRDGLNVIARLGELPPLGRLDITLEATAYGGVLGLRALVLVLACALYATAVDPDEVLRLFRRFSFRSALTATLATRMVPVLGRDARRLADAQRCRPGPRASRLAIVRATAGGALDRAVDVAATLELRGYGAARRPRRARRPWSRHDIAFVAAAAGLVGVAVAGRALGWADFEAYPRLRGGFGLDEIAVAAALLAFALAPLVDRRGVAR